MNDLPYYRLTVHILTGQSELLDYNSQSEGVTWTTMNPDLAVIDSTGRVSGLTRGLAIIQAEYEGESEQIYVRISE